MTHTAEILTDDYTDFGYGFLSESGFHGVQDCPSDWAVGSDEAGDRIYSAAAISDYLQRDLS
jgi:hypothetical protein